MSEVYDDCLKRGKIKPFSRGKDLAPKESEELARRRRLLRPLVASRLRKPA